MSVRHTNARTVFVGDLEKFSTVQKKNARIAQRIVNAKQENAGTTFVPMDRMSHWSDVGTKKNVTNVSIPMNVAPRNAGTTNVSLILMRNETTVLCRIIILRIRTSKKYIIIN